MTTLFIIPLALVLVNTLPITESDIPFIFTNDSSISNDITFNISVAVNKLKSVCQFGLIL